jgi:hypothetical protein
VAITACIVGSPLAALSWAESAYDINMGPIAAAAVAVAFSAALGASGSALWMRHPRSRDIVFGDLMLWGFVRRLINEHRVLRATAALGLDRSDGAVRAITLSPERQTEVLQSLAHALEANDPYTHGHSKRVARHALMIAKTMGLSAEYVEKVYTAASIHDVGKLHLPQQILNKPAKLTDAEFEVIKEHPAIGAAMAADLGNGEITAIVRNHHERLDGRGYPDQLSGDAIPLGSRIIAVADTFDALTSTRAYRDAAEHKVAIDILKKEAGAQLDGRVVDAFLRYYSGSRTRTWWSLATAIPQRFMGWLGGGIERIGIAGLANGATAAGAAAVIAGASLGGGASIRDLQPRIVQPAAAAEIAADETDTGDSETAAPDQDRERKARDGSDDDASSPDDSTGSDGSGGSGGSDDGSDDSDTGTGGGSGGGSSGGGTQPPPDDDGGTEPPPDDGGTQPPPPPDDDGGTEPPPDDGDDDDGGLIGDVVDVVEETECGLLGLLC